MSWSPASEEAVKRIPSLQAAERVSRAVYTLAATGEGDIRAFGPLGDYRLHVGAHVVWLNADERACIFRVLTVYRKLP